MSYNQDVWRMVAEKVEAEIAAAVAAAVAAHEAKAEGDTFANSHVPAAEA